MYYNKNFKLEISKQEDSDDNYYYFNGVASDSTIDNHNDIVLSSAYADNLNENKVLLFNHDMGKPVGMTTSMIIDNDTLKISGRMPKDDDFIKNRILPQMKIGSLKGLSLGFTAGTDDIDYNKGIRTFKKINIHEISLVTIPANSNSKINEIKKLNLEDIEEIKTRRDFENVLRESKLFSNKACVYLSSLCTFESESQTDEFNKKMLKILNTLEKK